MNVSIEVIYFSQWPHLQHSLNYTYMTSFMTLANNDMLHCTSNSSSDRVLILPIFDLVRGVFISVLEAQIYYWYLRNDGLSLSTSDCRFFRHSLSFSSFSLLHSLSVTCVKQSALIRLLSVLAVVSSEVCLSCQIPSPCLVSVLQTGEGRRMSACQYPAASLLLVFRAHRAFPSVCCMCQGGM